MPNEIAKVELKQWLTEAQATCWQLGNQINELANTPAEEIPLKCRQLEQSCSQTGNLLVKALRAFEDTY